MERNLPTDTHTTEIELFKRVLGQKRADKNKIYSLHEPDVQCISKGKEHKKYEFGNKVSIVYTQNTGIIVGAMGFRNEYDGHTLERALVQHEQLTAKRSKSATVDRGYQGKSKIEDTQINIPKPFNKKLSKHKQTKKRTGFGRRAAIEPTIGHLKSDHRLNRNFYKGIFGDHINIMLAAAAFNFKRMINKYKSSLFGYFFNWIKGIISECKYLLEIRINQKSKIWIASN